MSLIGETKLAILKLLRDQPAHGYRLADELDVSKGYIYEHLDELQAAGMITVQEQESGGRQRITYELTDNGEMLLKALGE